MSERQDMLDDALLWDDAGHLSEPALQALADGELEILPSQAMRHAQACGSCNERVGEIALFALEIADALALQQGAPNPQLAAAKPPLRAIALALLVALVAGLPALRGSLPQLVRLGSPSLWHSTARALAQGLVHAGQSGVLNVIVWTSAAGLLAASAALVHFSPHTRRTARNMGNQR
jgi:hypothetical protein